MSLAANNPWPEPGIDETLTSTVFSSYGSLTNIRSGDPMVSSVALS